MYTFYKQTTIFNKCAVIFPQVCLLKFFDCVFTHYLKSDPGISYIFFRYFSGNLLTVVALLKCQKLRSHATTMFVISLAVSDLLFCTINLPLTASRYVHEKWILGPDMCRWANNLFGNYFWNMRTSLILNDFNGTNKSIKNCRWNLLSSAGALGATFLCMSHLNFLKYVLLPYFFYYLFWNQSQGPILAPKHRPRC